MFSLLIEGMLPFTPEFYTNVLKKMTDFTVNGLTIKNVWSVSVNLSHSHFCDHLESAVDPVVTLKVN